MVTVPTRTLSDGTTLPAIGFGTYPLKGEDGIRAIESALRAGYRLLDTAVNYGNEGEVGEAIRRSGVPREEIVVQTKVPGRDHAYDRAIASVEASLERLGLEQVDVALIHWPNPSVGLYVDAYRALVECRSRGLVRSVGVSNFTERHLGEVIDATGVTPVLNQVELHPLFPQEQLRAAHERLGILTEAWSPLGKRNAPFAADPVAAAAQAHGVTPAQAILRWQVQLGVVPLPKSADTERQRTNLDVFGFELGEEEVRAISGLGRDDGRLFGGDPDTHEEM
ncbi:aldo/keto reductase [Terrabacter sp. NPDC080008]|uniref:aldo/keto reductase n=1 Tax=Terrabacter sp. NPDC080008 TaxID=3155176 RepID=UPI00344EBDD2